MLYVSLSAPFFFIATATTEIYTLSLHDALPISFGLPPSKKFQRFFGLEPEDFVHPPDRSNRYTIIEIRSEEHTSELQSHSDLVCRLLLEKKKHLRDVLDRRHRYVHLLEVRGGAA